MASSEEQRLIRLLKNDPQRIEILKAVATLSLPDCWVAAGFVRNLVWDHLHNKKTDLNDVDVIYYCQSDTQSQLADNATRQLQALLPKVNWQVKNQALMHKKRQQNQYISSIDAMTFWPEQETAIAVHLDESGCFSIIAPFGLSSLFEQRITFNPKGNEQVFWQRIEQKLWLTTWPQLVVEKAISANKNIQA
jgi:hypothetical protein